MGARARRDRHRVPVARVAIAAALVAVAATVLVGVGVAQETPPAPVGADSTAAAPVTPGAAPAAAPATATWPTATTTSPGPVSQASGSGSAAASSAPATSAPASEAATPAPPDLVPGTPCTSTASACVDLAGHKAWLISDGTVSRGPVQVMVGDPDSPTPTGTFEVQWKAEQYTSREFLVQMPYAVFFADGGIAFHEGRQDTNSAGCVKLTHTDAVAWFTFLEVGDEVQIH